MLNTEHPGINELQSAYGCSLQQPGVNPQSPCDETKTTPRPKTSNPEQRPVMSRYYQELLDITERLVSGSVLVFCRRELDFFGQFQMSSESH